MSRSLTLLSGLALLVPAAAAQVAQTTTIQDDGSFVSTTPSLTTSSGNYHVLHNGVDVVYAGFGAGGTQVAGVDGLGTWIPGEELRGNTLTSLGDFGYKQVGWRETVAIIGSTTPTLEFPSIVWLEYDGENAHDPHVFTLPYQAGCTPFTGCGEPYGTPPGSPDSFLQTLSPAGFPMVLPNEGLVGTGVNGAVTVLAELNGISIPVPVDGAIYEVQFEWVTPLEGGEDIDGWWHWASNGGSGNQYWGLSNDELNVWQSHTVASDAGITGLQTLEARVDYGLLMLSEDPVTGAALAPTGFHGAGPYYATPSPGSDPNGGFDLGRGSQGLSLSGVGGALNCLTGLGNQDPAGSATPGLIPTLGFATFDNIDYDGDNDLVGTPPTGGSKLTWIGLDCDVGSVDPALAAHVPQFFGQVRIPNMVPFLCPVPFPQAITLFFFPIYTHDVQPSSWPDPGGLGGTPGSFGIPMVSGSSQHLPTASWGPVCILGIPLALQYGTSGLVGTSFEWNPNVNRVSGTRQLFLMD